MVQSTVREIPYAVREFVLPTRTHVIFEGVARDWLATRTWDPDTLRAHIAEGDSNLGNWF